MRSTRSCASTPPGSNVVVSVDKDGGGHSFGFTAMATLVDPTGITTAQAAVDHGTVVVSRGRAVAERQTGRRLPSARRSATRAARARPGRGSTIRRRVDHVSQKARAHRCRPDRRHARPAGRPEGARRRRPVRRRRGHARRQGARSGRGDPGPRGQRRDHRHQRLWRSARRRRRRDRHRRHPAQAGHEPRRPDRDQRRASSRRWRPTSASSARAPS